MPILHATAIFVDQFAHRYAGGCQMHSRPAHTAGNRKRTQSLAAMAAEAGKPCRPARQNVTHPVQGLKIVLKRGVAEQAHLRDIGRPQARLATLAFDRFDHRRLFTANIGAGATPELDWRERAGRILSQLCKLPFQNGAAAVILITQVDVDRTYFGDPGGDQHAFEESMRIALQIGAILESARLAFVNVDRHHFGAGLGAHDAPFAAGRKARTTQAAQARSLHLRHQSRCVVPALQALRQQSVTPRLAITRVPRVGRSAG